MDVLLLEPWDHASHRAILDDWTARSRHRFTRLGLSGRHWKWRMRHAAVTFARQLHQQPWCDRRWDAVFCSDMLNLAEFRGLAPAHIRTLPTVAYFHESQFTYPTRHAEERDLHFAYTNFITCCAADEVWFNSHYHRCVMIDALDTFLQRMPDHAEADAVEHIEARSRVMHPGIDVPPAPLRPPSDAPLRVAWAARWEHDKAPDVFFDACRTLRRAGHDLRLTILGESFSEIPEAFTRARAAFADCIDHWGFAPERDVYLALLSRADVIVSTARHEFFGLAILEGACLGCRPVVPQDLAYPETLGDLATFHDQTPAGVADAITAALARTDDITTPLRARFHWSHRAPAWDEGIERLTTGAPP